MAKIASPIAKSKIGAQKYDGMPHPLGLKGAGVDFDPPGDTAREPRDHDRGNTSGGSTGNQQPLLVCNPTTDICVPARPPGPPPIQKWAKWYFCGRNPANNVKNWALEGATKRAVVGAFAGSEGGPPVMFVTGLAGAGTGGLGGALLGGALLGGVASIACGFAGAYGPPPYIGPAF